MLSERPIINKFEQNVRRIRNLKKAAFGTNPTNELAKSSMIGVKRNLKFNESVRID